MALSVIHCVLLIVCYCLSTLLTPALNTRLPLPVQLSAGGHRKPHNKMTTHSNDYMLPDADQATVSGQSDNNLIYCWLNSVFGFAESCGEGL